MGIGFPWSLSRVLNLLVFASDFGVKRTPAAARRDATYEEMDQGSSVKTWACPASTATGGGGGGSRVMIVMLVMVIVEMVKSM